VRAFVAIAVALLAWSASPAVAQTAVVAVVPGSPGRYLQAGGMIGAAAPVVGLNLMAAFDGGLRLGDGGAWVHAAVSYGALGDDQGPGSNGQLRGGIEGRACVWNGAACGVDGIDIGYQRGRWADRDDPSHNESSDALVAIPRLGLDVGGESLRARIGIEIDYAVIARQERQSPSGGTSHVSPRLVGVELGAGIGYQW
jgi:hypothetical protein